MSQQLRNTSAGGQLGFFKIWPNIGRTLHNILACLHIKKRFSNP